MHLTEKLSEGDVIHANILFRRILKYFSRLFKPLHIHQKKQNTNEDTQLLCHIMYVTWQHPHMLYTITHKKVRHWKILSLNPNWAFLVSEWVFPGCSCFHLHIISMCVFMVACLHDGLKTCQVPQWWI